MSKPLIGEIQIYCGASAPHGWLFCHGQAVKMADYTQLYSIIGSYYGGDKANKVFNVPDLRGVAPLHTGHAGDLSSYRLGQKTGSETVTLTVAQMPKHSHTAYGANKGPDTNVPAGCFVATGSGREDNRHQSVSNNLVPFNKIDSVGDNEGHNNMQPYLALEFIIAYDGEYPAHG